MKSHAVDDRLFFVELQGLGRWIMFFFFLLIPLFMIKLSLSATKGKPRLEVPSVSVVENQILVVTRLKDAFSSELQKTIESGKAVSFQFTIQFLRSRFIFPDEKIWSYLVDQTVLYNSATREYAVTIVENATKNTKYTRNPSEMMNWISTFQCVLPAAVERKNEQKEHYVRIWAEAETQPFPGGFKTRTIYSKKFVPIRLYEPGHKE
ncbi:DUF4390 domain-containing protein [candidate division CSSED10-310 bacterium]|uniref:DUF4390 domain-containing protein n=1 Tax=candidate division CSSED10-310 bacterium TaxID=2855610 RepID=A0ABV6YU92_UNCC1